MATALWKPNTSRRKGAVIVMTAVTLVTLLIFAAFAVDVGYICALTAEQQNTADAAALAGATALRQGSVDSALERVRDVIARNQEQQGYLSLEDQIIEFGVWDSTDQVFTALSEFDWQNAFAVRVRAARSDAPLFFAGLIGHTSTTVWREAVAVGNPPCGGIWGLSGVRVPGNVRTDSYDSTVGPYDPATSRSNGDLCSGTGIEVAGSYDINGDVMAGFGYEVIEQGNAGTITGVTTSTVDGQTAPEIDMDEAIYVNDNETIGLTDNGNEPFSSGAHLSIGGNDNLTLGPGTYYFESVTFDAGGSLTLTGTTTVYLSGDFDASGYGQVNTTMNPADLTILSTGSSITMTGTVSFYGSIYAPNAAVELSGTSDYYGAIVADTVDISGDFEFHVDESLPLTQMFAPPPVMLVR